MTCKDPRPVSGVFSDKFIHLMAELGLDDALVNGACGATS